MRAVQRRFIIKLAIISIVIYALLRLISFYHPGVGAMPAATMVALLFAINSLAFMIVTNSKTENPRGFVYPYMTVSFGRLIICSAYVFVYALMHKHVAKGFLITFFILYFLYNIVEVRAIYGFFKEPD